MARRPRLVPAALAALAAVIGAGAGAALVRWLAIPPDPLAPASAVVVLGGDYPARIITGARLMGDELAPELWITGHVPTDDNIYTLAEFSGRVARDLGVPFERQHLLASTSTWEDAEQIRLLAEERGARSLLIVTSPYHSRRALCVIRRHMAGLDVGVAYAPAAPIERGPPWLSPKSWLQVGRELAAVGYYWLRYRVEPWSC